MIQCVQKNDDLNLLVRVNGGECNEWFYFFYRAALNADAV